MLVLKVHSVGWDRLSSQDPSAFYGGIVADLVLDSAAARQLVAVGDCDDDGGLEEKRIPSLQREREREANKTVTMNSKIKEGEQIKAASQIKTFIEATSKFI